MQKILLAVLAIAFALPVASQTPAQSESVSGHLPRGTATDVSNDEIMATVRKTATAPVSDQQISVVSINGEYNVGVGVVHRARTQGQSVTGGGGGIEHSQITEVYHIISGSATLVTGGTIENAKAVPPDNAVVKVLNGPSMSGGAVQGGISRRVEPGDVVIIPPNTPHWFSHVDSDQIVYLVVRVDTHHVLPAGYPSQIHVERPMIAANVQAGSATDLKSAEIEATTHTKSIDTQLRVVGVNDEYSVAIGALHRPHTDKSPGGALEHEFVTEVYHIISGTGTYVTGGTIENAKESPADGELVKILDGPTLTGGVVQGGVSRKVGPGDVIVIPPNTPHWFSQIDSDQVVYLVVRIDPHKVLPAGYLPPTQP